MQAHRSSTHPFGPPRRAQGKRGGLGTCARLKGWRGSFSVLLLGAALGLLPVTASLAEGTKTISGKLRSVKGNVLTVQKKGLASSSLVEIEMDDKTRVTGQVAQGMHVKVKYRGEGDRRIALEIEAWPEHASKAAREASKQTKP